MSIEVHDRDGELHVGMLGAIGRGERRDHRQRGRNGGDAQVVAGEVLLQRLHLGAHGARIGDDGARPVEHALALGGEAQEARGALDQHDAKRVLELLDAGGEARLGHAAGFGGLAEVAFAGERQEIFELIEHERL
jgi:hypothetical protein